MAKKMLVDATHPEETRVVVVQGTRLEDFDFESAARKQLIGNIYLAKVTRIEPSLQAAFVDYGGNRHGFLAFNEIHPDYYQIPVADRQALLEADAAEEQRAEDADEDVDFKSAAIEGEDSETDEPSDDISDIANSDYNSDALDKDFNVKDEDSDSDSGSGSGSMLMAASDRDSISSGPLEDLADTPAEAPVIDSAQNFPAHSEAQTVSGLPEVLSPEAEPSTIPPNEEGQEGATPDQATDEPAPSQPMPRRTPRRRRTNDHAEAAETQARQDGGWEDGGAKRIESVGGEDALDEVSRPRARRRQYKIQEVIKKRQIMLVQILKDERGSKGAALTTYLSIPGRYCVLMPNTARGGGISRKITNAVDRKRLKAVAAELEVPEGMGLIIRTAGANRTKAEIKRDFDYLLRQWEIIRELTLRSSAPCLINEEGSIVKRAVRDLYDKDIEIIQVEGEASYREAKDFMRMLMPSHAKKVQPYREAVPLFQRYQVEAQLDSMFDPTVRLKSGGYIVINPTEALVSIDVNSGKATREANIEATALKTNMEAAEELARQLRLRDLAGLIVIDFIDMDNLRNNKAVERKIKECLATDRANIQIGRISPFGLLEMSRQRLRQGVVETTTRPCGNCHGTGLVRSVDSLALRVLRGIEEECQRRQHHVLDVLVPSDVAIYILNQKRHWLHQIEARAAASIFIIASDAIQSPNFEIKASERIAIIPPPMISAPAPLEITEEDEAEEPQSENVIEVSTADRPEKSDGERRRKRGRGRTDEARAPRIEPEEEPKYASEVKEIESVSEVKSESEQTDEEGQRRKMRRRRRGRGRSREREETQPNSMAEGMIETEIGVDTQRADSGTSGDVLIIPIFSADDAAAIKPDQEIWSPQAAPDAEAVTQETTAPVAMPVSDELAQAVHEPQPITPHAELMESEPDRAAAAALPTPIIQQEAETVLQQAPQPEPVVQQQPDPVPAPEPEATPAPHIEVQTMLQHEPAHEPAPQTPLPEAPAGPKRAGWWQRQFGKT